MTLQQFGIAFLKVILFMVVWAVVLLAAIYIPPGIGLSDNVVTVLILILTPLIFISFLPYLNYVAKSVFFSKGEGQAISQAQLQRRLEEMNTFDAPVMVQRKRRGYLFTWRYVDARWWEAFQQAGLTEMYELHVKLNERQHRATLTEVTRSVNWGVGVDGVHLGWSGFRGVVGGWERGVAWGIRENFAPGKLYDYTFTPSLVKNPVINTILRSGWDVRFAIF
ncbi:MAG: hypothetical protein ACJ797_14385 [Ktedonobacteraceae bacterium]